MTGAERLRHLVRLCAAPLAALLLCGYLYALHLADPTGNLITRVETFRDDSGALTLPQVFARRFDPASATFRGSFDPAAHWFRLRLALPDRPEDVLLEIGAPSLDDVTLYLAGDTPMAWQALRSGDHVPFSERASRRVPISFVIPQAAVGQTVYLRVQSTSSTSFTMAAEAVSQADAGLDRRMALHVVYFALLVMGMGLAGVRLLQDRTALSLSIFGFFTVYLVSSAERLGYAIVLFDDPVPLFHDRTDMVAAALSVLLSMLFQRLYLRQHNPDTRALFLADLVILAQGLLLVPLGLGYFRIVGFGTVALSLVFLGLLVVLLFTARIENRRLRRVVRAAYALYIAVAAVWLLSRVGLVPPFSDTLHIIEIFGLNSLFLALTLMVIERGDRINRQRAGLLALAAAQSAQAAQDRDAAAQDSLLSMLLHDLRNNLSVLQISLPHLADSDDRAAIAASIRTLTFSLTRAQHLVWLEQNRWPAHPVPVTVIEVLDRVIESLGLSQRVLPQGDAAEAMVHADPAMFEAILSHALQAAERLTKPGGSVILEISQATADAPCRLDLRFPLDDDSVRLACEDADLDLVARLATAMQGRMDRVDLSSGQHCLSLTLPA